MAVLMPVSPYRGGGFLEAEKKNIPQIVISVFGCLIYVQERREIGQSALETTLNEPKNVL